jgi:hypothetical protein
MTSGIVGFEILLAGKNLVEDKMSRRLTILVQEIENVVGFGAYLRHQREGDFAQFPFFAGFGAKFGDDRIGAIGDFVMQPLVSYEPAS